MTWHPKPSLTVETLHWTSSNVFCVPLLSSSRIFQRKCKNLLSSENITLDHSAAVQSFLKRDAPDAECDSIPIKSTLDNSTTVQYTGLLHQLTMKARSTVRDIDPQNDLMFLRIRSKKHEIMVSTDKEYLLIVIQNPAE
uniref:Dynein light chain roadblock-type 2 n=1 Tax=Cyprinus carpio TaxID=7962 RepID=A0A8C1QD08_CYPCA